jgi:DNA polymerase-2
MGLIEGLKVSNASLSVSQLEQEIKSTIIEGFDGAYFSRKRHFLPDIIETLWIERDKAKLQKNAALSQAIKIIMNSFYGILGSTGCRFFDPRLSGSITKRSHQLLKTTGSWISHKGYQVIYGDTDSIFVAVGADKSEQDVLKIGKELQDYINASWQKKLKTDFNISSKLEIEFETHFSRFFMPTIRGTNFGVGQKNIGTKKRYAGLSKNKLVFKGLESVRSDWTALSKEFQQALYMRIFNNEPIIEYVKEIVDRLKLGHYDDKLVYQKKIRRKLAEYVNTPPHIKAVIIANKELQRRGVNKRYSHRSTIQYIMTIDGVRPLEFNQSTLDYDFYIEKQLKPIADDILPFIGIDFDSIVGNQMDLF